MEAERRIEIEKTVPGSMSLFGIGTFQGKSLFGLGPFKGIGTSLS